MLFRLKSLLRFYLEMPRRFDTVSKVDFVFFVAVCRFWVRGLLLVLLFFNLLYLLSVFISLNELFRGNARVSFPLLFGHKCAFRLLLETPHLYIFNCLDWLLFICWPHLQVAWLCKLAALARFCGCLWYPSSFILQFLVLPGLWNRFLLIFVCWEVILI